MSDVSDVEAAIVALLCGTPGAQVMRGWPTEADLQAARASGVSLIRIHAVAGLSRDVTRYPREWFEQPTGAASLMATLTEFAVTFSGSPAPGQYVGIVSQAIGYTYVVQAGDSLVSIVLAFAQAIPGAYAAGAVLHLPPSGTLPQVTVQLSGPATAEVAREQQDVAIAVWAISPQARDAILRTVMANVSYTYRLPLADGETATLMEMQSMGEDDTTAQAGLWRRDVRACYDYPVTYTKIVPPVTVGITQGTVEPTPTVAFTEYVA